MLFGILKSQVNTGSPDELACVFTTPLSIVSNQPEFSSDTISLKRVGASQGHQRWELEAGIAQGTNAATMMKLLVIAGRSKQVYIRMPPLLDAIPEQGDSPKLLESVFQGATSIRVTDFPNAIVGMFIQFAGDKKIYFVTDKSGDTLTISPAIRKPVLLNTDIIYGTRCVMHAFVDDGVTGIKYESGILTTPGTYKFVEDV